MKPYSYAQQLRSVIAIEIAIVVAISFVAVMFWTSVCTDSLKSCMPEGMALGPFTYLLLSLLRPFVLTPHVFLTAIAGEIWGPFFGALLAASGGTLSCVLVMAAGRYVGRRMVKPWLTANLPATWKFLRSQDLKIVFFIRMLPLPLPFAFDICSLLFGVLGFRFRVAVIGSFFGSLPEAYVLAKFSAPDSSLMRSTLETLVVLGLSLLVPLLVFEYLSRKKGSSLWSRTKAMYQEIISEVRLNNEIVKRHQFDPDKTPVLLLYGFFSSRRALTVLEKLLVQRGHQVMSFNLGGLLGTFFTRSILETANFVDYKVKRQMDRHGFKKINIVAHSKGGFVALWWVLKLGGSKYCNKVITMGTPFAGSRLTYLALITPLGFFWRDVWQMRPRSSFLQFLQRAEVPQDVKIYCMYSRRDSIARGHHGIFQPKTGAGNVFLVPMNHVAHFEFLFRRDVADTITNILSDRIPFSERPGDTEMPEADSVLAPVTEAIVLAAPDLTEAAPAAPSDRDTAPVQPSVVALEAPVNPDESLHKRDVS